MEQNLSDDSADDPGFVEELNWANEAIRSIADEAREGQHKTNDSDSNANIDTDVVRFRYRLEAVVAELAQYPRQIPYHRFKNLTREQRPMGTPFFTLLNVSSYQALTAFLL